MALRRKRTCSDFQLTEMDVQWNVGLCVVGERSVLFVLCLCIVYYFLVCAMKSFLINKYIQKPRLVASSQVNGVGNARA